MSRKVFASSLAVCIFLSILISGCGPEKVGSGVKKHLPKVDLALNYTPGQASMYKVTTESFKDFKF